MNSVDLCIFLTSYTLVVAFAAVSQWLRSRTASSLVGVIVALAALSVATVIGFYVKPGSGYLELLWFLVQERDFSAVAAAGLGVAAALGWLARLGDRSHPGDEVHSHWIQRSIVR